MPSFFKKRIKRIEAALRRTDAGSCRHPSRIIMPAGSYPGDLGAEIRNAELISLFIDPKARGIKCRLCGISLYRRTAD